MRRPYHALFSEFRFVNETGHDVEYFATRFQIPSGEERIHEECSRVGELPVKSPSEDCFKAVYRRHYWYHAPPEQAVGLILFDDNRCILYESDQVEGLQDLQNFERTGDLQFTHHLNQELYNKAVPCEGKPGHWLNLNAKRRFTEGHL